MPMKTIPILFKQYNLNLGLDSPHNSENLYTKLSWTSSSRIRPYLAQRISFIPISLLYQNIQPEPNLNSAA
jgi:hypothetical protein